MFVDDEMNRQREASARLFSEVTGFVVFNQVCGDILEFGVYKGDSLIDIYHWMTTHWAEFRCIGDAQGISIGYDDNFIGGKRFFAFDSFEGLPSSIDPERPIHFVEGAYKSSRDDFVRNLQAHGVDISKFVISEGWYDATLSQDFKVRNALTSASLIYIDCDLRESAVPVFKFITDLIQDGTLLLVDDFFRYKGHPNKGIRGVFNEWAANNPQITFTELTRCCGNRVAFVCSMN